MTSAEETEPWETAKEIEARLSPPESDPEGVFGGGAVVECVARCGVLVMPEEIVVGLNLTRDVARRSESDDVRRREGSESLEFSPVAAKLLREYLTECAEIVSAVVACAYRGQDGKMRTGKFLRGFPPEAAAKASAWRKENLPASYLAVDAEELEAKREAIARKKREHAEKKKRAERDAGANLDRAGGAKANARGADARHRDGGKRGGGDAPAPAPASEEANRARRPPPDVAPPAPAPAPVVLVPAGPPSTPAWGAAAAAAAATGAAATAASGDGDGGGGGGDEGGAKPAAPSLADILREEEEASRAQRHRGGGGGAASASASKRPTPGVIRLPKATGGWADLVRGGTESGSGGGDRGRDEKTWEVVEGAGRPPPPKIPKISPAQLAANARLSKIDQFGKIRCLVCTKTFKAYGPLEQHLAANHFGLNSNEAKAIEAGLLAAGVRVPGDGSEKTKTERHITPVNLGEILRAPKENETATSIANSLSAYIRQAAPSKKERREKQAAEAERGGRIKTGAFYFTLVPIRPRRRGERRSLRTFAIVSLRPHLAFNPRPRRLSTPTDAFQLHPRRRDDEEPEPGHEQRDGVTAR